VTVLSWTAVVVFVTAYVLIATERIHRVAAALGGAAVMLVIGATDAEHAFFSPDSGIDWNVIVPLLGMMLIVAVVKHTGLFEYVAIWAAKRAQGAGGRPISAEPPPSGGSGVFRRSRLILERMRPLLTASAAADRWCCRGWVTASARRLPSSVHVPPGSMVGKSRSCLPVVCGGTERVTPWQTPDPVCFDVGSHR
jgi:hypothetical protein